jgi:hypothetical protein
MLFGRYVLTLKERATEIFKVGDIGRISSKIMVSLRQNTQVHIPETLIYIIIGSRLYFI